MNASARSDHTAILSAGGPTRLPLPPIHMKRITAFEFEQAVCESPAWAANLTEPVGGTRPNDVGEAADYSFSRRLEIATGIYPGDVDFSDSGIRAVRDLTATNAKFEDTIHLEDVPHGFLDLPNLHFDPDTLTRLREIEARRAEAL